MVKTMMIIRVWSVSPITVHRSRRHMMAENMLPIRLVPIESEVRPSTLVYIQRMYVGADRSAPARFPFFVDVGLARHLDRRECRRLTPRSRPAWGCGVAQLGRHRSSARPGDGVGIGVSQHGECVIATSRLIRGRRNRSVVRRQELRPRSARYRSRQLCSRTTAP